MSQWVGVRNPVSYAWFCARGGLRTHGIIAGAVMLGLVALLALTLGMERANPSRVWAGWAVALLVIQSVVIALVGGLGVAQAIRADVASGMHDSLRLMRTPPGAVVAGYLFGATSQVWAVVLPCAGVGVVASVLGGVGAGPWVWAMGMLLVSSVVWVVMAAWAGFLFKQATTVVVALAIAVPASVGLLQIVPGLAMLYGPAAGAGVLDMRSGALDVRLVLSVLAQTGLAAILFAVAMRKYRRPEGIALGWDLGVLLVGLWAVASLVGALMWETVRPRWMGREDLGEAQVIGSLLVGQLLAVLTAASTGRMTGEAERRRRGGAEAPKGIGWGLPVGAAVVLATMPVAVGATLWQGSGVWLPVSVTAIVMLSMLVSVSSVGRWCHRQTRSGRTLVVAFVLGSVVLPMVLETILQAVVEPRGVGRTWGYVAQFSPLGLVINAWSELGDSGALVALTVPGALAQAALAGALLWWSRISPGRGSEQRPEPQPEDRKA